MPSATSSTSTVRTSAICPVSLKPGGRFHITEGHPLAMVFSDDATEGDMRIAHPYFEGSAAMHWSYSNSYTGSGEVTSPASVEFAHNMGAIIQALIDAGLVIDRSR